jgi:hypothetical protein
MAMSSGSCWTIFEPIATSIGKASICPFASAFVAAPSVV